MNKVAQNIGLVTLKVIIRILLIISLVLFVIIILKFRNSVATFAGNMDNVDNEKNDEAIYVNTNNESDNKNEYENLVESNSENNRYLLAFMDSKDKYPEGWINEFNIKIIELQKKFPNGKYWNHMGQKPTYKRKTNNVESVTDIPCNHNRYGELYCNSHYGKSNELYPYKTSCSQCRGFASMLSDEIFGAEAPVRYFENYDELRIGDQARIDNDYHSVFIIDKTDEYVIVAECNSDLKTCQISWGRKILRENMNGWYISRWSD